MSGILMPVFYGYGGAAIKNQQADNDAGCKATPFSKLAEGSGGIYFI
jgi:hypothetical protein